MLPVVHINKEAVSPRRLIFKGTVTMTCKFSSHVSCRAAKPDLLKKWQADFWDMTAGQCDWLF